MRCWRGREEGCQRLKINISMGIQQGLKMPHLWVEGSLVPGPCKPEESKPEQTGKARWCMPRSQTAGELHKTTLNRILTLSQQGGASASVV